jgi:hypothetical protein
MADAARIAAPEGRLAENVVHFSRALRAAGLAVGTDRLLLALQALPLVRVESRAEVHATLAACLIDQPQHRSLFERAFALFWHASGELGALLRSPPRPWEVAGQQPRSVRDDSRRLGEAFAARMPSAPRAEGGAADDGAPGGWTDLERLRKVDFESMSPAEWTAARRLLAQIAPFLARRPTRRDAASSRGRRLDLRAALRECGRHGGDVALLPRRRRRLRREPLVVLVDISGSMHRYSRMFLHFLHAITALPGAEAARVEAFVFGTRLTRITRRLRQRDPDAAIADVVQAVPDWSGGTRIAACLHEFNRHWAGRVLAGSPTVLLVTDGLEHAQIDELGREAGRLARSCRRLVWLNPLLRYAGFEPKARGVRALLPQVSMLLPVHDLDSLQQLARVLAGSAARPPETTACN